MIHAHVIHPRRFTACFNVNFQFNPLRSYLDRKHEEVRTRDEYKVKEENMCIDMLVKTEKQRKLEQDKIIAILGLDDENL